MGLSAAQHIKKILKKFYLLHRASRKFSLTKHYCDALKVIWVRWVRHDGVLAISRLVCVNIWRCTNVHQKENVTTKKLVVKNKMKRKKIIFVLLEWDKGRGVYRYPKGDKDYFGGTKGGLKIVFVPGTKFWNVPLRIISKCSARR